MRERSKSLDTITNAFKKQFPPIRGYINQKNLENYLKIISLMISNFNHPKTELKSQLNQSLEALPTIFKGFNHDVKFNQNKHKIKDFKQNEEVARFWGKFKYQAWRKSLSYEAVESILKYTNSSTKINTLLRKNREPDTSKWIELDDTAKQLTIDINNIDQALSTSLLEKSMIVYRRIDLRHFFSKIDLSNIFENDIEQMHLAIKQKIYDYFIEPNKIYLERTFVSTSITEDPKDIVWRMKQLKLPILLRITLPVGIKAAYIGEVSWHSKQNELLIARQQKFQYLKMRETILHGIATLIIDVVAIANND